MADDRTRNSTLRQLAALNKMSPIELKEKWKDLYGTEPPGYSPQFMLKRLAYRIQELFYGGVSEHTAKQLKKVAKAATPEKAPGTILPGTRFVRIWNNNRYEVIARKNGFEYAGRMFRSLSAVATEITGVRWNGPLFFGLRGSDIQTTENIEQ